MRLVSVIALLALAGCSFFDKGLGPPRTAEPGQVAGTITWDRLGAEPDHAEQMAQASCASHGLEAQTQAPRDTGALATMRYACR